MGNAKPCNTKQQSDNGNECVSRVREEGVKRIEECIGCIKEELEEIKKCISSTNQDNTDNNNNSENAGTYTFCAWVPTPIGYIDFSQIKENLKRKNSIKAFGFKEADNLLQKAINFFNYVLFTIDIKDDNKGNRFSGTISIKLPSRIYQWIASLLNVFVTTIFLFLIYILIIIFGAVFIGFEKIYTDIILIFIYIVFVMLLFAPSIKISENSNIIDIFNLNKSEIVNIDFQLCANGIIAFTVNCKDSNEKQIENLVRHAYHKFFLITLTHIHRYHSINDDNILVPQQVTNNDNNNDNKDADCTLCMEKKDWAKNFLRNTHIDAHTNFLINKSKNIYSSWGTVMYLNVFRQIMNNKSNIGKNDNYLDIGHDTINSYDKIADIGSRYASSQIEERENVILHTLKNLLQYLHLLFYLYLQT